MISIGTIIANRIVLAMTHKFVLAECIEESPEPFTVWRLDNDMNGVHYGSYFTDRMDAEREFCSLAFPWFQDNVAINFIDEKRPASEVEAPEQVNLEVFKNCLSSISKENKTIATEAFQRIRQLEQLPKMK